MKKPSPTQVRAAVSPARRRLLVVESGACAFSREGGQLDETVAVAQLPDEPAADLAERVLARIASVERSHLSFDVATLFVGAAIDSEAAAARRLIALAVAAHAATNSRLSEMVIVVASPRATDELRAQLLDLVNELILNPDQPLSVRVRFAETPVSAPLESGVFWTLDNTDPSNASNE